MFYTFFILFHDIWKSLRNHKTYINLQLWVKVYNLWNFWFEGRFYIFPMKPLIKEDHIFLSIIILLIFQAGFTNTLLFLLMLNLHQFLEIVTSKPIKVYSLNKVKYIENKILLYTSLYFCILQYFVRSIPTLFWSFMA